MLALGNLQPNPLPLQVKPHRPFPPRQKHTEPCSPGHATCAQSFGLSCEMLSKGYAPTWTAVVLFYNFPHLIPVQRSSVSWRPAVIVGLLLPLPPSPPDKVLTRKEKREKRGRERQRKYVWCWAPQTNTDPCAFGCSFCTK